MTAAPLLAALLALAVPGRGEPYRVHVLPVDGLQADSLARREFLDAFHGALGQDGLRLQRFDRGGWGEGPMLANHFDTASDAPEGEAWTLHVTVTLPAVASVVRTEPGKRGSRASVTRVPDPKRRSSRRFGVTAAVRSPIDRMNGDEREPVPASLAFPAPPAPDGTWLAPSLRGYRFPWADAGRAAGLVALEALHRASGDLGDDLRIDLAPALRADLPR